jgi:hypothetical protein
MRVLNLGNPPHLVTRDHVHVRVFLWKKIKIRDFILRTHAWGLRSLKFMFLAYVFDLDFEFQKFFSVEFLMLTHGSQ